MLIFLALVLGPGCGFMLYALSQFWREARRFRHADPRRLQVTVVAPAKFAPGSEKLAQGKVDSTYLDKCLTALPAGTGRVAMKHAVKRSS
jgi:hypothetical protein